MKDYDHVVMWLDYFNKTITRAKGRRLGRERCVFDPSLAELEGAARAAGLEVTSSEGSVRHPRRQYVRSGYIVVPKSAPKSSLMGSIASRLVEARARRKKDRP